MGDQLATGKFQWSDWIEVPLIAESIGAWLERFEKSHWEKTKKTDAALTTWKDYRLTFNRLNGKSALTTDALLESQLLNGGRLANIWRRLHLGNGRDGCCLWVWLSIRR